MSDDLNRTDLEDLLGTIFALNPDIRFRRVGNEAVVLHQDQGEVMVLNDVGARVLELIDGQTVTGHWLRVILEEYDVEGETLRADVARYLQGLREQGVITEAAFRRA